ncbi:MAG: hypothetical protein LBF74_13825, partial [Treponema sp.]|nr:hypothetical protein [Treponema sp.]
MSIVSVKAADPCIQYFGRWTSDGDRRYTTSRFSTVFFSFRGDSVELSAVTGPDWGRAAVYLDGNPPEFIDLRSSETETKKVFEKAGLSGGTLHWLSVAALGKQGEDPCYLEITGFAAEEPVDYPALLREWMEAEYRLIRTGAKKWTPEGEWKAVPYGAETPSAGVRLLAGPIRELFDRNIANLKY